MLLEGGILGRADDMMIIRGMNIYPTSIEQILHSFPEVVEYRMTARKRGEMDELVVEVEDHLQQPQRIARGAATSARPENRRSSCAGDVAAALRRQRPSLCRRTTILSYNTIIHHQGRKDTKKKELQNCRAVEQR